MNDERIRTTLRLRTAGQEARIASNGEKVRFTVTREPWSNAKKGLERLHSPTMTGPAIRRTE